MLDLSDCKIVLEPTKLAYANKNARAYDLLECCSQDLQIGNSVISKGKSAIHSLVNSSGVLHSGSVKQSCLQNFFKRN